MIIHKLIARHLRHCDDEAFYRLQAADAIAWIERHGPALAPSTRALDLGCGHGLFGSELMKRGCRVTFADANNYLLPELAQEPFRQIDLDRENPAQLGSHDLVICSNVLEHLAQPRRFISQSAQLVEPGGFFYLSWTNWLSPWGGHEFSPFHYLGSRRGHGVFDKVTGRKRTHTPGVNLFPTYIGRTLGWFRQVPELKLIRAAPRYYPELAWLIRLPGIREFLTWNCAMLLQRRQ